jgi:hypothetical protein
VEGQVVFKVTLELVADNNSDRDSNNCDDSVAVRVRTKVSLYLRNNINKLVIV